MAVTSVFAAEATPAGDTSLPAPSSRPSTTSCSATVRRAPLEWRFVLDADLVLLVRLEMAVAFPFFGGLFKAKQPTTWLAIITLH